MTRRERWTAHAAAALVGGSGVVYAWMRYALQPEEPYAIVNHPWQPHVQHLHVVAAPLLVWMLGHLWAAHASPCRRAGTVSGRASGAAMMWTAIPMVASGVLIQAAVSSGWRTVWIIVHLVSGFGWLAGYLAHLVRRRRRWRERGPSAGAGTAPLRPRAGTHP